MVNFGEFLKNLSLRSNSVTRQVTLIGQNYIENARIRGALNHTTFTHCGVTFGSFWKGPTEVLLQCSRRRVEQQMSY